MGGRGGTLVPVGDDLLGLLLAPTPGRLLAPADLAGAVAGRFFPSAAAAGPRVVELLTVDVLLVLPEAGLVLEDF